MFELSRMLAQGFADLEPMTVSALFFLGGVLVGSVLSLAAFAGFAIRCISRKDAAAQTVAAVMLCVAVAASGSPLRAQAGLGQDVQRVEPSYTRLFGADSLQVGALAAPDLAVSVSPDGRWLAYESLVDGRVDIWVVSTEGGDPVRITRGGDYHDRPTWFPSSDRIAFRAAHGQSGPFIFTVEIDSRSGEPIGSPRQVTIESTPQRGFAISPDGRSIAYPTNNEDRDALRVVPANGGAARTVWEGESSCGAVVWPPDRNSLYCVQWHDARRHSVLRVPADGGEAETVSSWSSGEVHLISPDARYVYRKVAEPSGQPPIWELATIGGRALGRFTLPENMAPAGFWPEEGELIAVSSEIAAPLRIMPVNGGPTRQLTETRAYDVPLRWTADGREVFFETQLDGKTIYMLAPVDGRAMRQVPLPEPKWWRIMPALSGDARHVFWAAGADSNEEPALKLFDLESGETEIVTESPCRLRVFPYAWDGDRYLYCVKSDGRHEYRASTPSGETRLLRSFPASDDPFAVPSLAVHGERIAFVENTGEHGALYVGFAGEQEVRRVAARDGRIGTRGMQGPVWSPDGRRVAVAYAAPNAYDVDALIVEVSEDGERVGEPTVLDLEPGPSWWWGLQWLADSSGFLVVGMGSESAVDTDIWLVSLNPADDPVRLTADDPGNVWGFALSPDGRHIAYSSDVVLGSSFWRVDLSDALEAQRR
ncbi:MAG: hypothetical protein GTO46_05825 [Gemmatimonadetes bacterium]|nr:hypothetical protein [Gemmatimonadota bacterium]NIO31127.1 hypothetical protein [Gemmatimonadota bacterium]